MTVSALEEQGLSDAWDQMNTLTDWRRDNGHWDGRRQSQAQFWFHEEVKQGVLAQLETGDAKAKIAELAARVSAQAITPSAAADHVLSALDIRKKEFTR